MHTGQSVVGRWPGGGLGVAGAINAWVGSGSNCWMVKEAPVRVILV